MEDRGWDQVDFVYVTGDAYVDHPSFGHAIITRLLEASGYRVGSFPSRTGRIKKSDHIFGEPRLAFLVSAGNMDSMVNHYLFPKNAGKRCLYARGRDGETAGLCHRGLRQSDPSDLQDRPVIIGGIEASLRRLAHYDYWSDKAEALRPSGFRADLISYGMGERSIVEIADALDSRN